ncbi:PREDICTED: myosin heavy chain, non-muscle isoform X2 [Ceratosolen solmsi marchali]|uniref:Myosin heavy chain, non-muscle isoform X2 n=1 Tax=Ceratosolen solmsi marchali TaxID=326594 RepID=A0AAJ6YH11_9HYME|nr:PREDICTED: myosin heavy chain, non-muscle isoform X2 [Ceratosolen solmsi marchali]
MSDSDDTDDLLLIPPDFFIVSSLDSDDRSEYSSYREHKTGVVSELIDHMQSLESRIFAIESKESSDTSLNCSRRLSFDSVMSFRQTLPRTISSVSQTSNIQNTPTKYFQCSSLPSTPSVRQQPYHTNEMHHSIKLHGNSITNNVPTNSNVQNKHDNSKLLSEPTSSQPASQNKNNLHVGTGFSDKESSSMLLSPLNECGNVKHHNVYSSLPLLNSFSATADHFHTDAKPISNMSLSEVDEFLQEVDNNDKGLMAKNGNCNGQPLQIDSKSLSNRNYFIERDDRDKRKTMEQKLKFSVNDYQSDGEKRKDVTDCSLFNDTSFSSFDTEKFMTEFKAWSPTLELSDSKISITELKNYDEMDKLSNAQQKKSDYICNNTDFSLENKTESLHQYLDANLISRCADEFTKSETFSTISAQQISQNISDSKSLPSIFKTPSNVSISKPAEALVKKPEISNNGINGNYSVEQSANIINSIDARNQRPQRLLTLSDLWNNDSSKSLEEQLRIKLEEERVRREHCEKLIQELQKKLLEQQEKIAVAVRLDNEKNSIICQFQVSWKKTKQRLCELESERETLDKLLKTISDKHQSEVNSCQEQIKSYKEELSKALNLATGYKEKSDSLIKEKVDMLNSHANELQNYKSLVQQAETRYEEMKVECQKLFDKNQQTDETLKVTQQDLTKELLKSNEVRNEMTVIHKALDACETELIILRQEKENLQLKLKEEGNRNNILEQSKASLIIGINEAKESEKLAKNEIKSLSDQHEKLRVELRDVYQKQVDEVVKAKLQEFQTQLDSAEMIFQNEIETKQLAIAECAARKIKSVIDKHKLEINLIEEKHIEEKKLFEIKAAQATQRAAMLEAQLSSNQKSKSQLVEQLHSMLQKQWQQALLIISGGNGENMSSIKKLNVDKLFTLSNEKNLDLMPSHCSPLLHSEPMKLDTRKNSGLQNIQNQEHQNENLATLISHDETPVSSRKETTSDLRKYIKMILDMQQAKEDYTKPKFFNGSPPTNKESSEKQSSTKDISTSNEDIRPRYQ